MCLRKSLSGAIILSLSLCMATRALAEESSKSVSLGLSLATAMADEKDVAKGLKKVVNDETSTWLMSLIGGPDALFNEQINDVSAIKGKIDEVVGIINSIEKISYAIGEGKYDVAAIEAMDKVVGKVNHPLVTLTWSAVKMTYESHLLVQSTKAALDIETLYNVINKDRKMMGTIDPGSDQPPTIAMDKAATEYFFNKYVMTNDKVRQALKAYVTTVLGEQWPEQSWSDWIGSFRAIGTGLDTAKDAELAMLDKDWRDKGSSWVRRAIKDVNKKVKLEWARVRLSQAQAEFKRFSDRVGHFYNGDFQQMLREYIDIKRYKKELPMYIKALAESQQERSKVAQKIAALKPKDLKDAGGLLQVIGSWSGKVYSYSSRADMIREKALGSSLLKERQAWKNLSEKLDAFIGGQEGRVEQEVESNLQAESVGKYVTKYWGKNETIVEYDFGPEIAQYRKQCFLELKKRQKIEEFEWGISLEGYGVLDAEGHKIDIPEGFEIFKEELLEQCNQGNFNVANRMVYVYATAAKRHLHEWRAPLGGVFGNVTPTASFSKDMESVKVVFDRYASGTRSQGEKDALHAAQRKRGIIRMAWAEACAQAKEVAEGLMVIADQTCAKNIEEITQIYDAFLKLRAVRNAQYDRFASALGPVLKITGLNGLDKTFSDTYKSVSENEYTFFTPITSDNPLVALLPRVITQRSHEISRGPNSFNYAASMSNFEKNFQGWTDAVDLWNQIDKLNDEDIQQIQVFLKTDRDLEKETQLANQIAGAVPGAIAQIRIHYKKMITLADRDGNNRAQDSGWLIDNARYVQRLINELIQNKWMRIGQRNELEVIFPGGVEDGMVRIAEPYSHYMLQTELDELMKPIKAHVNASKATAFMKTNTPDHYRKLQEILNLTGIKAATDENFIAANRVVYSEDIKMAENLINSMNATDKDFVAKMAKISKWLPLTLNAMTDKELAYYKKQANIYNIPLEEYYEKVLGRTPSKTDYSFNYKIDLNADFLDKHEWGKKYLELRAKLKTLFDERRGAVIIKRREKAEAEAARLLEAQRRKMVEEGEKRVNAMGDFDLAGFYGYTIENARLNSRSLAGARGDVIVTKQTLISGDLLVSARLSTIDRARTILLSSDGGQTWKELRLTTEISFRMTPLPNKPYDFILRIKTTDGREPRVRLFNWVNSITYKNIDYEQLIVQTTKTIAEAYERTNMTAFSDHISRTYLGNKSMLEEGVRFDFDLFTNIRLTIYITRIEARKRSGLFIADTKWDKVQSPRKTGQEQRTSGNTVFTFVFEDGKMKIKNLRGDLIYATLSPEIAQASGKNPAVVDQIRTARDARNPEQPGAGTTDDTGGVTLSSVTSVTVQTSPVLNVPGYPGIGFDFTGNSQVAAASANSDADFEGSGVFGSTGIQKITGTTFDTLNMAPGSGYGTSGISTEGAGTVYAFITNEGYYGKMEVLSFADNPGGNLRFKFAVQTDGTTNLKTN